MPTPSEAKPAAKRYRPSIFLLLLVSMAVVLTGTVAALSWVAINRYTENYKATTLSNYGVLAKHVSKITVNTFTNLNFTFLERSLVDIADSPDIHFVDIVNGTGEIYLSSNSDRRARMADSEDDGGTKPSDIELVQHRFKIERMDGDWLIQIGVSLEPFRAQRKKAIAAFVGTSFIVLAPVLLIAYLLAKYLSASLSRLVATTHRMSEQGADVRAEEEMVNEMNELASAFNDMVGSLRLRRFLSPQVADLIVSSGEEDAYLRSHRREVATLFCDLRGFTDFSESVEPEEAMKLLQDYHAAMGKLISDFEGTIDHRAGDGIMVLFNDPLPCDDPAERAARMAVEMRERMLQLSHIWSDQGYQLGFGVGISFGYATMGVVGYEGRVDYTANGSVVNLASRLCDEARDGQILITQRAAAKLERVVETESLGELSFKGFHRPVKVFNVLKLRDSKDSRRTHG